MGNVCGCNDSTKAGEAIGQIKQISGSTQYKQPNYQSKITASQFTSLPDEEKNNLLTEAFKILVSTVEPGKIQSNNPYIKQFTMKQTGTVQVAQGTYEGELVDGVANGKGTLKEKDGYITEGNFFNGVENGPSKVTRVLGQSKEEYTTEHHAGLPLSVVTRKFGGAAPQDNYTLEGAFNKSYIPEGPHLATFQDGTRALYLLSNGKVDGTALTVSADGTKIGVTEFGNGNELKPATWFSASQATAAPQAPVQQK